MLFNVALSLPLYRRAFIFMMHTMNKKKEKTDILDKIYPNMAFQSPFAVHRAKDRTRLLQATKKENTPAAASSSRKLFVRTYSGTKITTTGKNGTKLRFRGIQVTNVAVIYFNSLCSTLIIVSIHNFRDTNSQDRQQGKGTHK